MARDYPTKPSDFGRISGIGEKKLAEFGAPFMAAIREHLATKPN